MKNNEIKEMRAMNIEQLKKLLSDSFRQQLSFKIQHAIKQLKNTDKLRKIRHTIARLKTVLTEKSGLII